MISNYFTLAGLAHEWSQLLPGVIVEDIYSPHKDELSIDLMANGGTQSVRISVRPGFHFVYRSLRAGRPRSNVTTLFENLIGETITSVEMSPSDRILAFRLGHDRRLEIHLYGSRANVFVIEKGADGDLIDAAFKRSGRYEGEPPPLPKELPKSELADALNDDDVSTVLEKRLSRLRPRLGKPLIREWIFRAGIDADVTGVLPKESIERLEQALAALLSELDAPSPALYRPQDDDLFSLVALTLVETPPDEVYSTVDEGVRTTVRRRASVTRLETERGPLLRALERASERARRSADQLEKAVSTKSRADEYERWGHLLMANPNRKIEGNKLTVADILADGEEIDLPVKSDLTAVANAERYYAKARNLRTERATLDERLQEARKDVAILEKLLSEASAIGDVRDVERFRKSHTVALRRFIGGRSEAAPAPVPFRRFRVGGFDVWVGRNARENDRLTFDHASPHDLWFHARGVGGSHVVLRLPGRKTVVGKPIKLKAAAIAAWFSSARGSGLVPVIVTERKYVSKPKGSDPGAVRVHREEVLMVEPHLP